MCPKLEESLGPDGRLPVDHGFIPELDFVGSNSVATEPPPPWPFSDIEDD
jgi:hypothetical protein